MFVFVFVFMCGCVCVCVCVCVYLRKKMIRIEERSQFVLHKEEREKMAQVKLIKYDIHKLQ